MRKCVVNNWAVLPSWILLDGPLRGWLQEDIGRGDRSSGPLCVEHDSWGKGHWVAKEAGVIAGLPVAERVFYLLDSRVRFEAQVKEGSQVIGGTVIALIEGPLDALLTGERVALNLAMRLSGVASLTRQYVEKIIDLPSQFVDTRKTTPGLRLLEKYASRVGGATNHRMGLDDGVMIKDNHSMAAGGIAAAIAQVRRAMPYPLTIEVETENLAQVEEALAHGADIIMLDNMSLDRMHEAVQLIRAQRPQVRIEASGNVTLETIRAVAQTGVDYISSSAPITRAAWLDLSMRLH
jgi:nicotinate-nucleotide pyrophosphorylase (carboxylating)